MLRIKNNGHIPAKKHLIESIWINASYKVYSIRGYILTPVTTNRL